MTDDELLELSNLCGAFLPSRGLVLWSRMLMAYADRGVVVEKGAALFEAVRHNRSTLDEMEAMNTALHPLRKPTP